MNTFCILFYPFIFTTYESNLLLSSQNSNMIMLSPRSTKQKIPRGLWYVPMTQRSHETQL